MIERPGGEPPSREQLSRATKSDLEDAIAAQLHYLDLSVVRMIAREWRNGFLAIATLTASVAAVVEATLAKDLEFGNRLLIGAIFISSLAALTSGLWSAMTAELAAVGADQVIDSFTYSAWRNREVSLALRNLGRSKRLLALGIILLSLALGAAFTIRGAAQ